MRTVPIASRSMKSIRATGRKFCNVAGVSLGTGTMMDFFQRLGTLLCWNDALNMLQRVELSSTANSRIKRGEISSGPSLFQGLYGWQSVQLNAEISFKSMDGVSFRCEVRVYGICYCQRVRRIYIWQRNRRFSLFIRGHQFDIFVPRCGVFAFQMLDAVLIKHSFSHKWSLAALCFEDYANSGSLSGRPFVVGVLKVFDLIVVIQGLSIIYYTALRT